MTYEEWVVEQATKLNSDGCTVVSELYHWCCLEHDLGYRWEFDPRVYFETGEKVPIKRSEVDHRFRECIQSKSPLHKFSPVSWIRWIGVRVGGFFLWKKKGCCEEVSTSSR